MNRWIQVGIVLAGYALALVASVVTVVLYDRRFTPAENQTMGGMIAGGEMMLGAAMFLLLALVPTGLALWFLRRSRMLWSAFSGACLGFAIVGLLAVLTPAAGPSRASHALVLDFVGLLGIVQMLGSPLWIGGFALFAALAPTRDLRIRLLVATAIELVVAGCALVHFLVPIPPI